MKKQTAFIKIFIVFLFFVILSNSYSQFRFQVDSLPEEISLSKQESIADVGNKEFGIHFIMANYDSLNPTALKTINDDLGFSQNNFWAKFARYRNRCEVLFIYAN